VVAVCPRPLTLLEDAARSLPRFSFIFGGLACAKTLARVLKSASAAATGSPGCANIRQALASPHPGRKDHRVPSRPIEFPMCATRLAPGVAMVPAVSRRLVVAVGFAMIVAGCASGASVAQVKTNPGRYVDKNVTVRGTVTSSWGIPLVPFKMYQVDDGTGEILVVSQHERVPSKGARVKVTGKVGEFAVFGGRSIGLHMRERDLDYDGR
jgi:hypothetical protein